jgi:3-hydroxymyristoyl/3-hydroxydecanoyl-(acyl carrier protein) dehydratase
MTFDKYSDHCTPSHIQTNENKPFVIGADVITYLTGVKHPMIMVDRIINYNSDPLSLVAERYVSANEPAFVGHFPNLRLWPGIYTLEGLRQACYILQILHKLEEADMLKNLLELHNRQILRPQINHELCNNVIDYLKCSKMADPDLFSVRIKLLEPVFAGSLVRYHCVKSNDDPHCFSVDAAVEERVIAKGEIIQPFDAGS